VLGARGNSGVILSQLIRGAAEELASRPGELVDPVSSAPRSRGRPTRPTARSATQPRHGSSRRARDVRARRIGSRPHDERPLGPDATDAQQNEVLAELIENALAAGEESVKRGPDLLPVLREAGVVDAGGYG